MRPKELFNQEDDNMDLIDNFSWRKSEWFIAFTNVTVKKITEHLYSKIIDIFNVNITVLPIVDKSGIYLETDYFSITVKQTGYEIKFSDGTQIVTQKLEIVLDSIYFFLKNK